MFELQLYDDSLEQEHIPEGATLVFKRQSKAKNGDLVLLCFNGLTTIRRYWQSGTKRILVSGNKKYEPIILGKDVKVKILGVAEQCRIYF